VIVFEVHEADTPVGKPDAVPIPVAPVVECVMFVNELFTHTLGVEDATLTVTHGRSANINPPKDLGEVLGAHVKPPFPVEPITDLSAQEAPTAGVLPTLLCPASYNSVNEEGDVAVQDAKLLAVVVVILVQFPNNNIAEPLLTEVRLGILERLVELAVYQEEGAVTSNGVVLSTPENAIIAAVAAEDDAVTVNV
jgi:hypothetical protein